MLVKWERGEGEFPLSFNFPFVSTEVCVELVPFAYSHFVVWRVCAFFALCLLLGKVKNGDCECSLSALGLLLGDGEAAFSHVLNTSCVLFYCSRFTADTHAKAYPAQSARAAVPFILTLADEAADMLASVLGVA